MESQEVMESQDLVSVFRVSVASLETLNTLTTWFRKTSVIQRFFRLLYRQVRNNKSRQEECHKFEKNSTAKWWYFFENF